MALIIFSLSTWARHSAGQGPSGTNQGEQLAASSSLLAADKAAKLTCLDFSPKGTYRMEIQFKKQATLTSAPGKRVRSLVRGEKIEALKNSAPEFENSHCEMSYRPLPGGRSNKSKIVPPGAVVAPRLPIARINDVSSKKSKIAKGCIFDFTPAPGPLGKAIKADEWGLKCFVDGIDASEPTIGEMMELMKDFAEIKVYRN